MELSDIIENPGFWILVSVGYAAFSIMIIVLKKMGQASIMPLWVKIATIIFIPIASAAFLGIFSSN